MSGEQDAPRHRDHLGRDRLGSDAVPDQLRTATPVEVRSLVDEVVAARGWTARLRGARVHEVWDGVVGAELARHVRPVRLHGGVLVVEASSAVWATQVRYLTGELVERLNDALGATLVEQVRVTVAG